MITQAHSQPEEPAQYKEVVPVFHLISTLWRRRRLVGAVTGATLVASLLLLLILPPSYDARMVVAPVATQHNLSSKLGGLSSLTSVLGVHLGGNNDNFEKFRLLLTSSIVAKRLEERHRNAVLSAMFPNEWDVAAGRWVEPDGLRATVGRDLRLIFGLPGWAPPNANSMAMWLKKRVHVNSVPESDLIEVTFSDRNPQFARNLLFWLYDEADEQLRDAALASAKQELSYVNGKLKTETVLEDRKALVAVLFQLEQKIMMAHATRDYAAMLVDGPSVSNLPDSPKPIWFIVFGILFGLMFGSVAAVVADAIAAWRT
jgi:capsular polysaccharide biosynthesis protein